MKAILPKGQAYLLFLLNEWTCTEQWRKTRSFADARVKSLKLQIWDRAALVSCSSPKSDARRLLSVHSADARVISKSFALGDSLTALALPFAGMASISVLQHRTFSCL
jgi:hypothetical protein